VATVKVCRGRQLYCKNWRGAIFFLFLASHFVLSMCEAVMCVAVMCVAWGRRASCGASGGGVHMASLGSSRVARGAPVTRDSRHTDSEQQEGASDEREEVYAHELQQPTGVEVARKV
jgi:hypothetical protein